MLFRDFTRFLAIPLFGLTGGCAEPPLEGPPATPKVSNVILIVCDTLRADHLETYGYRKPTSPFLKTLSERSLVYESAFSHYSYTWPTISNLFTGRPYSALRRDSAFTTPRNFTEPGLVEANVTLAERLADRGVQSRGVSANPYINKGTGFGQGFSEFHDIYSWNEDFWLEEIHKYTAEEVNDIAYKMLKELSVADQPWFLYLHYFDSHMPYIAPKPDRLRFEDLRYSRKGRVSEGYLLREDGKYLKYMTPDVEDWVDPSDLEYLIAQYDAEIHHLDRGLRSFFEFLEETGLGSSTIVIVTSDHGEAFMERKFWGHGFLSRAEEERIPLIVTGPGLGSQRIKTPATTTDLFHTILDHFGTSAAGDPVMPWQVEVFSGTPRARVVYSEGPGGARIYRSSRYALYRYLSIESANLPIPVSNGDFLFNLEDDPAEVINLLDGTLKSSREIADRLVALAEGNPADGVTDIEEMVEEADAETRRRLRALGYVQ